MSDRDSSGRFAPGNPGGPKQGRFQPGQSGNPGGPPIGTLRKLREQFGDRVLDVFGALVELGAGGRPAGYTEEIKTSDRVKAAEHVLNRLLGKPKEHVEVSGGLSPDQQALFEALRLTPHERRIAAAQDTTEAAADDAAMTELVDGDDA